MKKLLTLFLLIAMSFTVAAQNSATGTFTDIYTKKPVTTYTSKTSAEINQRMVDNEIAIKNYAPVFAYLLKKVADDSIQLLKDANKMETILAQNTEITKQNAELIKTVAALTKTVKLQGDSITKLNAEGVEFAPNVVVISGGIITGIDPSQVKQSSQTVSPTDPVIKDLADRLKAEESKKSPTAQQWADLRTYLLGIQSKTAAPLNF